MSTIAERAEAAAEQDWHDRCAVRLHSGDIYADKPIIDSSGFYLMVCWEGDVYVAKYNATIRELVRSEGLPPWAPGSRIPREHELSAVLAAAQPFERFASPDKKERNLVRRQARFMRDAGIQPSAFATLPGRDVVVLMGADGAAWRFDAVDTHFDCWMATFVTPRPT